MGVPLATGCGIVPPIPERGASCSTRAAGCGARLRGRNIAVVDEFGAKAERPHRQGGLKTPARPRWRPVVFKGKVHRPGPRRPAVIDLRQFARTRGVTLEQEGATAIVHCSAFCEGMR